MGMVLLEMIGETKPKTVMLAQVAPHKDSKKKNNIPFAEEGHQVRQDANRNSARPEMTAPKTHPWTRKYIKTHGETKTQRQTGPYT